MEYVIEANPLLLWASAAQAAACLGMIPFLFLKIRPLFLLSGLIGISASIYLHDATCACGLILCLLALWKQAGKKAKKIPAGKRPGNGGYF